MLSEGYGLPLVVGVTAANTHDSAMFIPLIDGIPAIRSRRGPRRRRPDKLHADKAYDAADLRAYCRTLGIAPRIARRGSSATTGWADTDGASSARSPGCSATGA